jgi:hypothetical protein
MRFCTHIAAGSRRRWGVRRSRRYWQLAETIRTVWTLIFAISALPVGRDAGVEPAEPAVSGSLPVAPAPEVPILPLAGSSVPVTSILWLRCGLSSELEPSRRYVAFAPYAELPLGLLLPDVALPLVELVAELSVVALVAELPLPLVPAAPPVVISASVSTKFFVPPEDDDDVDWALLCVEPVALVLDVLGAVELAMSSADFRQPTAVIVRDDDDILDRSSWLCELVLGCGGVCADTPTRHAIAKAPHIPAKRRDMTWSSTFRVP